MNKTFISKAFKDIKRTDHQAMAKKGCDIIRTYANEYGYDASSEYYQTAIDTILYEKIQKYSRIKGYRPLGIAVEFVMQHLDQFNFK